METEAQYLDRKRRETRRYRRQARLYPALFLAVMLIYVFVHFVWHPY